MTFPAFVSLPLSGSEGFRIDPEDRDRDSRLTLTEFDSAGDLNGDGIDDFMLVAPSANDSRGRTYVIFGDETPPTQSLSLADLDGLNGFRINGANSNDGAGTISPAGDVNGDGIDDIIIGANTHQDEGALAYVIYGSTNRFPVDLNLGRINGSNGFAIEVTDIESHLGVEVSGAGDINNDGFDDVIVSAPSAASQAGASFVVFGGGAATRPDVRLADLNGRDGFRINGVEQGDLVGITTSSAGDVNGDGIDDVLIGSLADPGQKSNAGENYVVFGSNTRFPAALDLADLDGTNGFSIPGLKAGDRIGDSISSAGDVNGDGLDDFIFSFEENETQGTTGGAYVVFGSNEAFPATFDLTALNGTNGFRVDAVDLGSSAGTSAAGVGDVNGDGLDDVAFTAPFASPNGERDGGETYVIFGQRSGFPATVDVSELDGRNGFTVQGQRNAGLDGDVAAAGDINNDGFDDILLETGSGAVVLYGREAFAHGPTISSADLEGGDLATLLAALRDFDGNDLGTAEGWKKLGEADIQNDNDDEFIFVNSQLGRWASLGPDARGTIDLGDHGEGGETRVVGVYLDPLVEAGIVQKGSDHDSARRFENDLRIDNLILLENGDQDYDGDGLQQIYFKTADGTAYLHALMHADGNIQYANYQSEAQMIDYLSDNGFGNTTYDDWLLV